MRAVLAAHGGREVDTAGDGFLARFDAPASAVGAAAVVVAAVAPLGIEIRAGLHTSEVELDGEEMTGVGVHLAARVPAEAGPGQVLVSATVRELMAGRGLGFVDLGERELKGFAERWRLFALDPATVLGDGDEGANPVLWEPTAEVEGRGGTGVRFPGLLSVGHSAGYVGRDELLGRLERVRLAHPRPGGARLYCCAGSRESARPARPPRWPRAPSTRARSRCTGAATRRSECPISRSPRPWTGTQATSASRSWVDIQVS